MKKSFQFAPPSPETDKRRYELEINSQVFELRADLTGIEMLEAIASTAGGPGTARGAYNFLKRVVTSEDWDRFSAATAGASPQQIGDMVGELINAYAAFPTTPEGDSSDGQPSTGSTSESSSETPA